MPDRNPHDWLTPDWPAPARVRTVVTTRRGGVSIGPYASMNPAAHVGDHPAHVAANRAHLREVLALPAEPVWLQQVHGTGIVDLDAGTAPDSSGPGAVLGSVPTGDGEPIPQGDGALTRQPGRVCAVLTADCLPVLLTDRAGSVVAAAHAGWRGLAAGVIEAAVAAMDRPPAGLLAWLGPAIGPAAFEIGEEVRTAFVDESPAAADAFRASAGKWRADLYLLARQRLEALGVEAVHGGGACTYTDAERFYSYRRDGTTGRMASLIWIAAD